MSKKPKTKTTDKSKPLCSISESPLTPGKAISILCEAEKIEKLRQDGLPDYLLRDAVQAVFLTAIDHGAFNGGRWRDPLNRKPGDPHFSELLRYAKDKGYVNWQSDEATYKGVIDEAAGQLIELLRQEAAANNGAQAEDAEGSAQDGEHYGSATKSPPGLPPAVHPATAGRC